MSLGADLMAGLSKSLGLDRKLAALCLFTLLATAAGYAALAAVDNRTLIEGLIRFPRMVGGMVYWALVLSPFVVPFMLIGWSLGWVVGGVIRLPPFVRACLAAAVLGGGAVVPFLLTYAPTSYAAENHWRNLIRPLLWITPISATLIALIIYRRR